MAGGAALPLPNSVRLRLPTKLAYGFGSIAYGIKDNGFSTLLLLFYNQVVGLPASTVGLAIMLALILDAFIDPVIGHLSDQTRSRWGRRHPFMYAAAIPIGICYLLLWNPPTGNETVTVVYLVAVAILVRTMLSCYEVPSSALAPELTSDYHERTSVLGYRYLFGWLGGMGMLLLTFSVFLAPSAQYPVGQLNPEGYKTYSFVAAAIMVVAILISAYGTHSQIPRLPRFEGTRSRVRETFTGIVRTLRNKAFAILIVAGIFNYTNQGLNFALSTYFNTFLWEFPAWILAVFTVAVLIGVALAFASATRLSRIWGKRQTAVRFAVVYSFLAVAPFMLRYLGWFPANGDPMLLPVLMALTTFAVALGVGGMILGASMMSDVVEQAQERSGERSEGLFFAGSFFMQKCVSGIGLFLSGALLSAVAFPEAAVPGEVPQPVLDNLILSYSGITVVLGLIGAAVIARFPISEADHVERLARLAETASHANPLPGSEAQAPAS